MNYNDFHNLPDGKLIFCGRRCYVMRMEWETDNDIGPYARVWIQPLFEHGEKFPEPFKTIPVQPIVFELPFWLWDACTPGWPE